MLRLQPKEARAVKGRNTAVTEEEFRVLIVEAPCYGLQRIGELIVSKATLCKQPGKQSGERFHNHGNLRCDFNIPITFQNGNWPLNYVFL